MWLRSDHSARRSFAKKGQMSVISRMEQRFDCNMVPVVPGRERLGFMAFKERFRAGVCEIYKVFGVAGGRKRVSDRGQASGPSVPESNTMTEINGRRVCLFYLLGGSLERGLVKDLNKNIKNAVSRQSMTGLIG
ncbi:MAG: hypothetical protein QF774_14660 [Nitrospinota bacterium]|jgi:hypothetical protein|nr:hypothetical protein [Nitrospinota bacterium]